MVRSMAELQDLDPDMAAFAAECEARDVRLENQHVARCAAREARLQQEQVVVTPAVTPRGQVVDSETRPLDHVPSHIELQCAAWGNPSLPGVREKALALGYSTQPSATGPSTQRLMTPWAGGLGDQSEGMKTSFPC